MDLSEYFIELKGLKLSSKTEIIEKELIKIFEQNNDQIVNLITHLQNEEEKRDEIDLENGLKLVIEIEGEKVAFNYESKIKKEESFAKMLNVMCQEITKKEEDEDRLKDQLIKEGFHEKTISEIDDFIDITEK
ncbi:MAG: hypothetical protein VW378_01535 [bacterium]